MPRSWKRKPSGKSSTAEKTTWSERMETVIIKELPPCPFCGKRALTLSRIFQGKDELFKYVCSLMDGGCGASTGFHRTEAAARKAWERRQETAPKVCNINCPSLEQGSCNVYTRCCRNCPVRQHCGWPCQLSYGEECKYYQGAQP